MLVSQKRSSASPAGRRASAGPKGGAAATARKAARQVPMVPPGEVSMSWSIRLAEAGDAEQVQAIYAPFCTDSAVSFGEVAPSVEEVSQRIARTLERWPWLVCAEGERVLGYAYASRHRERAAYRWSVEVSAYVADGQRGRGVGKALYTAL